MSQSVQVSERCRAEGAWRLGEACPRSQARLMSRRSVIWPRGPSLSLSLPCSTGPEGSVGSISCSLITHLINTWLLSLYRGSMDAHQRLQRASHNTAWSIGLALVTAVNIIGTIKKDDWGGSSGCVKTAITAFVINTVIHDIYIYLSGKQKACL